MLVGGTLAEFRASGEDSTNLSMTQITGPSIGLFVRQRPATADAQSSGVFDPDSDGLDFYESLEGMRVQVDDAVVVGPTHDFGSNRELYVLADHGSEMCLLCRICQ